jgi:scyllo-inositol 2-dehydrogenase (NADP+)
MKFKRASDIKVGVIGYGGAFNMGRAHLKEMQAAGMTPLAVAEVDAARLPVATQDFPGIQTYSSVAAMLKQSEVNLVAIITPHDTHAPLALQCLRAGRHVVCEKPLAITTRECDAMIAEARKRKLVLSTYHNRHWDGWILRAVEQLVQKKAIGDIFRVEARMGGYGKPGDWWRSSKKASGGILYDWGVHLLEYTLQLIDSPVTEVSGHAKTGFWGPQTKWKSDCIEDEGFATVRFKNGAWAKLTITQTDSNPKPGLLEITGTKGSYLIEWNSYTLIRHVDGVKLTETGKHYESRGHLFYENIAAHLTRGTPLIITPEWSRRPIHILDLAAESARKGTALKARYG